jgi:hypothetical protein
MTICLTLRETRGNTILWAYSGPSLPVYAMTYLIIYLHLKKIYGVFRLCDHIHVHVTSDRHICNGPLANWDGAPTTGRF